MTRYETQDGQSLGTTMWAGTELGQAWYATQEELDLLWSLDESEDVVRDNSTGCNTVEELLDLMGERPMLTAEQMAERGWGDRLDSGLALRQQVTTEGELVWTR